MGSAGANRQSRPSRSAATRTAAVLLPSWPMRQALAVSSWRQPAPTRPEGRTTPLPVEGAAALKAAVITVVLHYTTTGPLA